MIRRVFAQNYVFHTSEKNIIVVASTASAREALPELRAGRRSWTNASRRHFLSRRC